MVDLVHLYGEIEAARARLAPLCLETPLRRSRFLSQVAGIDVYLKLESLQQTGSFKIRGAYNMMAALPPVKQQNGVITGSAGNHGQGVARAANLLGIDATVVVPETAPFIKIKHISRWGAKIVEHGETFDDAVKLAVELANKHGMEFIPAFNDISIIAGQGTIGLEILDKISDVGLVACPVGGGGLICGIGTAVKRGLDGNVRVIGVEPDVVPSMAESMATGAPVSLLGGSTIADGIAVKRPGELTVDIGLQVIDGMIAVSDDEIAGAILRLIEEEHLVVEGAGAAAVAALLGGKLPVEKTDGSIVIIVSGGNIDVTLLDKVIDKGLVHDGRFLSLSCMVHDVPGNLVKMLDIVAEKRGNVLDIRHHRRGVDVPQGHSLVVVDLEVRDEKHASIIKAALEGRGFPLSTR